MRDVRSLTRYVSRRVLQGLLALFGLATIVFLMTKAIPGDEARVAAGPSASPEQVEQVRGAMGLNGSIWEQYLNYMGRLLRGDLGTSIVTHQPIFSMIAQVLPDTIELVALSMVLSLAVAIPLATFSALRHTGSMDSTFRTAMIVAASLPTYWLALVAQTVLGAKLGIFPIAGRLSNGIEIPTVTGMTTVDSLLAGNVFAFVNAMQHLILPAAVLSAPFCAQLYRTLRVELIRVLGREHLMVARAKGITGGRLVYKHALPNAMSPVITMAALLLGSMVGGAVLVESVFGLQGIGSLLTNAVAQKDVFALIGGVVVIGTLVIALNFLADLIQVVRDPRIRVKGT